MDHSNTDGIVSIDRTGQPLTNGLPPTALAGLDFHQLDSFEGFHPLTGILLSSSFAWRDEIPIFLDLTLVVES
jgi:hypothetical protein